MKRFSCLALIPPFFLDTVVAIGLITTVKLNDGTYEREFKGFASGFVYGELVKRDAKNVQYRLYLITNRHTFQFLPPDTHQVYLRFNKKADEPARAFPLDLVKPDKTLVWFAHPCPEIDIAIVHLNAPVLEKENIKFNFFRDDQQVADRQRAKEIGLTEGDGVFVLGFPMGLVGESRNYVVVRQGSIARIGDFLEGSNKEFLIDAFVFPGNSGGPVVIKPDLTAISGTKQLSSALLIGVVNSYIPYKDVAISQQTRRPRIAFEENSGLATVVPIDFVMETVDEYRKVPEQRAKGCTTPATK